MKRELEFAVLANALMMATMSKEELELAAELYNAGKSNRGK